MDSSILDLTLLYLFPMGFLPLSTIFFLVYMDDLLVIGHDPTLVSIFLIALSNQFSLKDLGALHYFLGVEVTTTSHVFCLLIINSYEIFSLDSTWTVQKMFTLRYPPLNRFYFMIVLLLQMSVFHDVVGAL